jgi:hypothetical protein
MYVTWGDSVQRPLTSGPRGWLVGQLLSRFRPKLVGHVFTREGKGYGGGESQWRPNSLDSDKSSARIFRGPIGILGSSLLECGSSAGILWILIESLCLSPSGVSGFQLVRIPKTLPRSGWFVNHSKLSNHFSYVICAFTYHMIESDIVLLYIQSHVWGVIYAVGPGVATVQTPQMPSLWCTAVEGPRHSHWWGVKGIVYACDAPGHTNCCGTHRSDSPIRAS